MKECGACSMKVSTRILSGFILIAVVGIALGALGLISNLRLTEMSAQLRTLQLESKSVVSVLDAHYQWRQQLTEAVMNGQSFTGTTDPDACLLAQWLQSEAGHALTDPEIVGLLGQIEAPHTFIHNEAAAVAQMLDAGHQEAARQLLNDSVLPQLREVTTCLGAVGQRFITLSDTLSADIVSLGGRMNTLIITMLLLSLLLCTAVAFVLIRWIINKLYWYENILDCIPFPLSITDKNRRWTFVNKSVEDMLGVRRADVLGQPCKHWRADICETENCGINCLMRGNESTTFTQQGRHFQVDVSFLTNNRGSKAGHIEVVQDITAMVENQMAEAALVQDISRVSRSFIAESNQVSIGAQALASSTVQQAASVDALSAAIADVSEKTRQNAEIAECAEAVALAIRDKAESGSLQMSEMIEAVRQIDAASQSISKVIKTIDDLAFQTNILALNAAVEAARAGVHGRGFAVVAGEVRNLATKSAKAAKDTEILIADSLEKSQLGVSIAQETAGSLSEIVAGIGESSRLITQIAGASEEQARAITRIDRSVEEVAQIMQQNSATAQTSATAAMEMVDQTNQLRALIHRFQTRNEDMPALPGATDLGALPRTPQTF